MTGRTPALPRRLAAYGAVAALTVALTGCATTAPRSAQARPGVLRVVAAESCWGSLAAQLGGRHATVTSIIDNPAADPHDYEPTAADGRAIALAHLVIVNGVGYDTWASRLVKANDTADQRTITVGSLVGVPDDGNPHRWYDPADVRQVIDQIATDYTRLDPADATFFRAQQRRLLSTDLKAYFGTIAQIRAAYAGTPVGASESVFAPLAGALGLTLRTPASFLRATSDGSEPTVADKTAIDRQLTLREVAIYVYNSQNATPDVTAQLALARQHRIPIASVTETLTPAGASFQDWQLRQLRAIQEALRTAAGR